MPWWRGCAGSASRSHPAGSACSARHRPSSWPAQLAARAVRIGGVCVNRSAAYCNREPMDDDELIARLADGDDAALRELFTRHAPWLAARLRAMLPAADVEDVLQETFLAAWRGARGYRPEGAAGGWLWGIARRQAALWLRRRGPAALLLPAALAVDGQRADDPAHAALARAELAAAVDALGPEGGPEREVRRLLRAAMRGGRPAPGSSNPVLGSGDPAVRSGRPAPRDGDPVRPGGTAGGGGR